MEVERLRGVAGAKADAVARRPNEKRAENFIVLVLL